MSIRRTAICRGAIVKGFLDGPSAAMTGTPVLSVVSTIARQSLGVAYSPLFDESRHLEKDRDWDGDEGVWRASNQMMWYLQKVCRRCDLTTVHIDVQCRETMFSRRSPSDTSFTVPTQIRLSLRTPSRRPFSSAMMINRHLGAIRVSRNYAKYVSTDATFPSTPSKITWGRMVNI